MRRGPSVLLKRPSVRRRVMSGAFILVMWIKMWSAQVSTGRRAPSIFVLIRWRSTISTTGRRALIVFVHVQRIWRLVLFYLEGIVFVVGFCRTTCHRGLRSPMATKLRWWRPTGHRKVPRWKPVVKMSRRWPSERRKRTSVGRYVERGWGSTEPGRR